MVKALALLFSRFAEPWLTIVDARFGPVIVQLTALRVSRPGSITLTPRLPRVSDSEDAKGPLPLDSLEQPICGTERAARWPTTAMLDA
jgi:hypothetical protein